MSNDINALREHLFDTLEGLRNGTIDIDKAKAMNETAQVIINSAKVEVEHLRLIGSGKSSFVESDDTMSVLTETKKLKSGTVTRTGNVTTHKMGVA